MGIKGTVRRSTDGDFIHANVDIDLIITEEVNNVKTRLSQLCIVIFFNFVDTSYVYAL